MVAHLLASKQGTLNSMTVTVLREPWLTWQTAVLYVYTHTQVLRDVRAGALGGGWGTENPG